MELVQRSGCGLKFPVMVGAVLPRGRSEAQPTVSITAYGPSPVVQPTAVHRLAPWLLDVQGL